MKKVKEAGKNIFIKKVKREAEKRLLKWGAARRLYKQQLSKHNLTLPSVEDAYDLLYSCAPDQTGSCRMTSVPEPDSASPYQLTVIVPCYNAADYLQECISSLLNQQTQYSYRLIFVNDGSTDETEQILSVYQDNKDICILTQENGGQASARNHGMRYAATPYLMFVDADDLLSPDCIEVLLSTALKENADVVVGEHQCFYKNKKGERSSYSKMHRLSGFTWNKIFSNRLFRGVGFNENNTFEDTANVFAVYPRAERVSYVDKITYFYRRNPKGVSYTYLKKNRSLDTVYITDRLLKDCFGGGESEYVRQDIYDILLRQIRMNFTRIFHYGIQVQKAVFVIACNWVETYFPSCKTEIKDRRAMEAALRSRDFAAYMLLCKMY